MDTRIEETTFEGRPLPKHIRVFRYLENNQLEIVFWRLEPGIFFMIPFILVWMYFTLGDSVLQFVKQGKSILEFPFASYLVAFFPLLFLIILLFYSLVRKKVILQRGMGRYEYKFFRFGSSVEVYLGRKTKVYVEQDAQKDGRKLPNHLRVENGSYSVPICTGWTLDALAFVAQVMDRYRV